MNPNAMLNFVEPRVAIHYFVLVLIGFFGVLQIVAARYQLKSLALFPIERQPWLGMFFGWVTIVGVFAWFITATPEMLHPGPAGFEIGLLFTIACGLALFICRLAAMLLRG